MFRRVRQFIERLEGVQAAPAYWAVALLCIITLRSLIELALEYPTVRLLELWFQGAIRGDAPASLSTGTDNAAMLLLHWPGFYITVFFGITLALSLMAGERLIKTAKATVIFFPIIWLPPCLDAIVTAGQGFMLEYSLELSFMDLVSAFYRPDRMIEGVSPGIRVEILLASVGAILYVLAKGKGILRALLAGLLTTLVPLVVGSWPGWVPVETLVPTVLPGTQHARIGAVYLVVLVLFGALWAWRADRVRFRAALGNLRWLRAVHYVLMVAFGVLIAGFELDLTRPLLPEVILPAISAGLAIFFAFQFNVQINDLVDRRIDEISNPERPLAAGGLAESDVLWLAALYGALSLGLAAAVHTPAFLMVLSYNALGLLYSAPPFRLRRYFPLATIVLAGCSILAVVTGFSVIAGANTLVFFPRRALLLFFLVFFAALNFKDMKDVEGDRAAGVYTLPVLLGRARGKWVVAALMFGAYTMVPLLLGRGILWLCPLFGLATGYLIVRSNRPHEPTLFGLYFASAALVTGVLISQPGPAAFPVAHQGHYYLMYGQTDRALIAFEDEPGIGLAERAVGATLVHLSTGDTALAVARARSLAERADDIQSRLLLAYALSADNRPVEALAIYREIVADSPDSAVAQYNLATILYQRGAHAAAETHYREALRLRPDWGEAHFGLGDVLQRQERYGEAETAYRNALRSLRGNASVHNNLGLTLEKQGRLEEALREFTRALAFNPHLQVAARNRQRVLDATQ